MKVLGGGVQVSLGGESGISVMEATYLRNGNHFAHGGGLHRSRIGRILLERQVRPARMIVAKVVDTATVVAEHDEDKENTERCRRHREEVDGDQVAQMIVEKAPPGLGRGLSMPNHVLGHRGLGDVESDLAQLAV